MAKSSQSSNAGDVYGHHNSRKGNARGGRGRGGASTKPSKGSGNAAGEDLFWSSVRTMVLVLVGMLTMLGAAYILSDKMWQLKHKKHSSDVDAMRERFKQEESGPRQGFELFAKDAAPLPPPVEFDTGKVKKAAYWASVARAERADLANDRAMKFYRQSLEIWPHQPKVWRELGELYLELKDLPRAKIALQRAAESDPSNVSVLTGLGEVFLREGELKKATELLDAAREINPAFPRTYFLLGKVHIASKDDATALSDLQKYLGFRPDDAKALFEKAGIEARRRQFSLSLETLKRAIIADPEWAELYYQAAAAAALMNKIDEAVRYLEKGEAFTDPQQAYRVYQSRAFELIRKSDIGELYEEELAERVRRLLQQKQESRRE